MSRELLQQCLDLITKLDKDGMVLEAELIFALRNELAKPEQESVAWIGDANYVEGQFVEGRVRRVWWECNTGVGQPLYTAPQRKEWVGLTDKERIEIWRQHGSYETLFKKVEIKLKDKNT